MAAEPTDSESRRRRLEREEPTGSSARHCGVLRKDRRKAQCCQPLGSGSGRGPVVCRTAGADPRSGERSAAWSPCKMNRAVGMRGAMTMKLQAICLAPASGGKLIMLRAGGNRAAERGPRGRKSAWRRSAGVSRRAARGGSSRRSRWLRTCCRRGLASAFPG